MTIEEYKEILKNGERTEWYGEIVPEVLITPLVKAIADMMLKSISDLEFEIDETTVVTKKVSKKRYLNDLWNTIKVLPYRQNGLIYDFTLAKYKRIMAEIEEEEKKNKKTKPKTTRTRKKKVVEKEETKEDVKTEKIEEEVKVEKTKKPRTRKTKNSNLIFGK
tara:strand:- start:1710 stop:2198 length:489 start_codon:yes stop_codon:yes gene_type:complete